MLGNVVAARLAPDNGSERSGPVPRLEDRKASLGGLRVAQCSVPAMEFDEAGSAAGPDDEGVGRVENTVFGFLVGVQALQGEASEVAQLTRELGDAGWLHDVGRQARVEGGAHEIVVEPLDGDVDPAVEPHFLGEAIDGSLPLRVRRGMQKAVDGEQLIVHGEVVFWADESRKPSDVVTHQHCP